MYSAVLLKLLRIILDSRTLFFRVRFGIEKKQEKIAKYRIIYIV